MPMEMADQHSKDWIYSQRTQLNGRTKMEMATAIIPQAIMRMLVPPIRAVHGENLTLDVRIQMEMVGQMKWMILKVTTPNGLIPMKMDMETM